MTRFAKVVVCTLAMACATASSCAWTAPSTIIQTSNHQAGVTIPGWPRVGTTHRSA